MKRSLVANAMRKLVIIVSLAVCFLPVVDAHAVSFVWGQLATDYRYFDSTGTSTFAMTASGGTDVKVPNVYLQSEDWFGDNSDLNAELHYDGIFFGAHEYFGTFDSGNGWPTPESGAWENRTYSFVADQNGNQQYDPSVTGEAKYDITINPGLLRTLPIVNSIQVTDGLFPTISWNGIDPRTDLTRLTYRIRLYENDNGNVGSILFDSSPIEHVADQDFYSFDYTGDWFVQDNDLMIAILAEEYDENNVRRVNRSRIYFEHTASPVPEPTTMLLLGAGLIGLAGARRKMKS